MESTENKKILTEENYQKGKKKLIKTSKTILIIGILLGISLIVIGVVRYNNVRQDNENTIKQEEVVTETNTRTEAEIQSDIDNLEREINSLKAKKNQEFKDNGFSEEYYNLETEISNKTKQLSELKIELSSSNSDYDYFMDEFTDKKNEIEDSAKEGEALSASLPFYIGGGFIIFISLMISGIIYFIAKGRDIAAFTMQGTIPLAQEGLEKITPTMKNVTKEMASAYGDIAREVAKGIEKGKKQGKLDRCSGCGATIDDEATECKYCGNKY